MRRILLWDYERGTWQYDLLVALIIATVFLAPGSFFGDRDRPKVHLPNAQQQKALRQANHSPAAASRTGAEQAVQSNAYEVSAGDLSAFLQTQDKAGELKDDPQTAIRLYLRERLQQTGSLDRYEVQLDASGQPVSYRCWLK